MANTHDYVIANDTGAAVRADFNTLFLEIEASNAGDSAPSNVAAGKLWHDTTTDHLKYYTGTNWVSVARSAKGDANNTNITGSITPNGTTTVPGSGTVFTTQAKIGDQIIVNSQTRRITAIASDTSLTVDSLITAGSADSTPEVHPASFVVLNDSGVIDMLIDTDGNIEGSGGIGIATTGKAIAMAVVFGG
jgi:hypothetical protein